MFAQLVGGALLAALALTAPARATPDAVRRVLPADERVPVLDVAPVARKAAFAEDAARGRGPTRIGLERAVHATTATDGVWTTLPDGRRAWQLRVRAPTAEHLSLGFERAVLPPGAELWLRAADGRHALSRPLTATDAARGSLWTPLVQGDELVLTLLVPGGLAAPVLELSTVSVGYRALGAPPPQGWCNVDVVCPEAEGWEEEIHAVAVYTLRGSWTCTGSMLSNTAGDQRPYFATANHCGVRSSNADSMVVYWNYESPACGDLSGGPLDDWQAGATVRAQVSDADWTLVELDQAPDPDHEVSWAGWDNSGVETAGAVVIHHPGTDEKAISFEDDATRVTWPYDNTRDLSGTHIRVIDWDLGTTEGGSSGSPLYDPDHRMIGVLTGGDAACGNDQSDWFGRLAYAWDDGGSAGGRLRDWLDPGNTGATTVDTLAPWATGVAIRAGTGLDAAGPEGGPFSPESLEVELENRDPQTRTVSAVADAGWVSLSQDAVTLGAGASRTLTLGIGEAAADLVPGIWRATVTLTQDGGGAAVTVPVALVVGDAAPRYSWDLDQDPGWDTEGEWAFGVPEGARAEEGHRDPSSGYTGDTVYGYNLAGGYTDNLRAKHLTTRALDMTALVGTRLRFMRWLGVEESAYDHATVEVSTDGDSWTTVWENEGEVDDGAWVEADIDISAVADDQPRVWIRWAMGATDESLTYCGWNIDDIEIVGVQTGDWEPGGDTGGEDTGPATDDTGPGPDGGDSGFPDDPRNKDDGEEELSACGCAAGGGGGGALGWLGLLGLVGVVRRRR